MQEDTYKKIKKSLRFEGSGEEVYVEIGMKNVPPTIKIKAVVDFLRSLFEEAINQLEDPVIPDERPRVEDHHRSSAGDIKEADISQEEFEKFMQEWIQKHRRTTFVTDTVLDKGQEGESSQDGEFVNALQDIKAILERMEGTLSATTLEPGTVGQSHLNMRTRDNKRRYPDLLQSQSRRV